MARVCSALGPCVLGFGPSVLGSRPCVLGFGPLCAPFGIFVIVIWGELVINKYCDLVFKHD